MLRPDEYHRLPLYSRHERIIFEEALERSKRYHNSLSYALSILYTDLRNSNDKTSASIAYELLDRCQQMEYDQNHNIQMEEWESQE